MGAERACSNERTRLSRSCLDTERLGEERLEKKNQSSPVGKEGLSDNEQGDFR